MNKNIQMIDTVALVFFSLMLFFIPISTVITGILGGFIFLCLFLRGIILKPSKDVFKTFFSSRINLSLLFFLIVAGLSMTSSGLFWKKSVEAWFGKWVYGILLFYCLQVFIKTKTQIRNTLLVFLASAFLISIDGLYQKIVGIDFIRGFTLYQSDFFVGIRASFNHYNFFSSYMVAMFFVVLGFFIYMRRVWVKWLLFLLMVLIAVNIFFAYSRGAWVSFVCAGLVLFFFYSDRKVKIFSLILLISFTAVIFTAPSLHARFARIFGERGDSGRMEIWQAGAGMVKESPFLGKGVGTFKNYVDARTTAGRRHAHNCYLEIAAEMGLFGLVLFLWFLGEIMIGSLRKLKEKNAEGLFCGVFLGFFAMCVHAFFDSQFYGMNLAALFWILLGYLAVSLIHTQALNRVS